MDVFARLLGLRYDAIPTRHAYYRNLRLIHEHFGCDRASISENQLRDYLKRPRFPTVLAATCGRTHTNDTIHGRAR